MSTIGNRIRWFSMLAGLLVIAATHAFGQADAPVAASGTDDGKAAEELLALSRATNGRVYIIEPARDQMLRTNGEQAGKVMLFFPEQQGAALTISLPVKTAGYYRIHARHVYGAWFQGRYGNYQLAADGVPMPGKCHGWYGPDGPPKHWPKAKTHLNDVDWGVVHLEPPHVDLAFRSADAGLLGVARILLEPVEPSQLTPEEKARRVPERRAEQAGGKPAKVLGSNSRFMEDISRYDARLRADKNQIQPASVTRQSYVDYIYPASTYGANAIRTGPDRAQYGVRHAFPALVHYDAKNGQELGAGIKRTLRLYGEKIRQTVKDEKWHSHDMHDPVLLCLYRKVFKEHNDWSADDEQWFKDLYVFMCRTVHVWDTPPDDWRGPMHRSTGEAIMKLLAVKMYPDIPEAAAWAEYGRRQWQDWWDYRDNPINDINAPFTQGPDSKALTDWVNMFRVEDLSGTATTVVNPNPHTPVNLLGDPGFEKQPDAGCGTWVGTQNAGKPVFERSKERPHSGQIAAKVTCRTGDVYARWVYQAPDLFARVKRGDRLKLSFWYRASAALGDALVQINHDAAPGWEQYPLKRLKATGDAWVPYEAVFTVAVNPKGGGEVQLRGTTDRTGDQVAYFDDVSIEVVGHEEPRRDAVVLGRSGSDVAGVYYPEGRIVFDDKPVEDWEFMATGTGVTGLTVNFPDEMVVQVNHSAAIDEGGRLRALGRLHLDLAGRPFANAGQFRMEHDLRKSVITAMAETSEGPVKVEIRSHVPDDVIRIDIHDGRRTPGAMTLRLEEDSPAALRSDETCGVCFWHENPANAVAPDKPENSGTGADVPGDNKGWLGGRVFGLALKSDGEPCAISDRTLAFPARARHSLSVAGVSTLGGKDRFVREARERQNKALREGGEAFVRTHKAWWDDFWRRSRLVVHDPTGRMLKYQAALDLYRYYLACCAGERRETPPRFQIDLYRYHLRQHGWLTGIICAVEQYQSYYGAMRTGDWGALRGLASFYAAKLPYYGHFARHAYGHGGARIPMWQGAAVLTPPAGAGQEQPPVGIWLKPYNGENPAGQIWMLSLFCDYVLITGDQDFARGVLSPLATDLVEFVRLRYPQRDQGRMVIAPCNAGETWQGVRDPSEMVCALHDALPRLITVARAQGWEKEVVEPWEQMLASLPKVPLGKFRYQGADVKPEILPGDQLVPAADMSGCEVYKLPWSGGKLHYQLNAQQTELYAIWPAKLFLRDTAQRDCAMRSYRERLWQHHRDGWNLDVVFAACLGLQDEVGQWHDRHFDWTYVLPCGLARETAPENPQRPGIPESSSLQGMGTGVIPVLQMLLQDYPDELIVLPCWPADVAVDFALYSPYAGRVEVQYRPVDALRVATQREIRVRTAIRGAVTLQVERLPGDGR